MLHTLCMFFCFISLPVSPCVNEPCKNGGQCTPADNENGYLCECVRPWTGADCDKRKLVTWNKICQGWFYMDVSVCIIMPLQNPRECVYMQSVLCVKGVDVMILKSFWVDNLQQASEQLICFINPVWNSGSWSWLQWKIVGLYRFHTYVNSVVPEWCWMDYKVCLWP